MSHNPAPVRGDAHCLLPWSWKRLLWPAAVLVAGLLIFPWSTPIFIAVYKFLQALPLKSFFYTTVQLSTSATVLGVAAIIYFCDRPRTETLKYLFLALLATFIVTQVAKQVAGRARPEWSVAMDDDRRYRLEKYAKKHKDIPVSLEKKDYWYGLTWPRPLFVDRYHSFPSGHAAVVFTIAAFLWVVYPQGRVVWMVAAVGCALARVRDQRHFLEDIAIAGALGWILAHWVFSWKWPDRIKLPAFLGHR